MKGFNILSIMFTGTLSIIISIIGFIASLLPLNVVTYQWSFFLSALFYIAYFILQSIPFVNFFATVGIAVWSLFLISESHLKPFYEALYYISIATLAIRIIFLLVMLIASVLEKKRYNNSDDV